jgi:hypothetical protein
LSEGFVPSQVGFSATIWKIKARFLMLCKSGVGSAGGNGPSAMGAARMYVEEMLAREVIAGEVRTSRGPVSEAIDRIRELRKQNTLGGLRTKDLIHEGLKY